MPKFSLFIFASILVIFQLSVLGEFFNPQTVPNIILAFVVSLVIRIGFESSLGWLVFSGIFFDVGTGRLIGSSALIFVLLSFGIDKLNSISNIQSRRMLFYPSFAVMVAVSLFLFDRADVILANAEKYFFSANNAAVLPFQLDAGYFWKTAFTVLSGYAAYYFLKKNQINDSRKVFQQKKAR